MKRRFYHALLGGMAGLAVLSPAPGAAQRDCAPGAPACAPATSAPDAAASSGSDLTRLAPVVTLAPYSQTFRDASRNASTLSYSTPEYVSHDVPRAVTLMYSSGQAAPTGFVQVEVTDNSTDVPAKMSIVVRNAQGVAVTNEIFYAGANGTSRMAATWDASALATGAYVYTVVVRTYWSDGTYNEASPVAARVLIVNERNSPYGSGWSVAGMPRIYNNQSGDFVVLVQAGMVEYFPFTYCTPDPDGTQVCYSVHPAGDFTTLKYYYRDNTYVRTFPDGSKQVFTSDGRLTSQSDRFGNQTSVVWKWTSTTPAALVPDYVQDPTGKRITFAWGSTGKLQTLTDPAGRVSTLFFNANGVDLQSIQAPDNSVPLQAAYDGAHRVTQWLDHGIAWNYNYDAQSGTVASVVAPAVVADGVQKQPTTYFRSEEAAVLPAAGKGTAATPADRRAPGDVFASITDPRGKVRWQVTDRLGLLVRDVNPFGWATAIERNDSGQVTHVTSPSGHSLRNTWSGVELTKQVDETTGDSTVVEYEHTYHQPTHVKRAATEVWNTYGTHGELLTTKVGLNPTTTYTYDAQGRVLSAVDPEQHGTFYNYEGDALGTGGNLGLVEVGAVGASNRRLTQITHDVYGRTLATYFPNGDSARVDYDVLNRRTRNVDGAANVTRYFYGPTGVDSIIDAKGQPYRFYHNALGWADSVADPNGYRERSYFDADGNVTSAVNRRGQTVSYAYDNMSRMISRTADGATTTWAYAIDDRWVAGANQESTDTVFYDVAGRPSSQVSVRNGVRYVLGSTYNAQSQRTALTMTAPWSRSIGYRYTPNAQLDTLIDLGGGRTLFDYNGDGQNTGIYLPNLVSTLFGVTSTHADANIEYNYLTQPHSLDRGFSIDRLGRVSARWNFAGDTSRAYTFDKAGRLINFQDWHVVDATCSGRSFGVEVGAGACEASPYREIAETDYSSGAFTYDAVGNRTDQDATVAWGNRLMSFGSYTMSYDGDGNMLSKNGLGKNRTYSWNSLGQLTSVTTNGATTSFGYDAFGNRVRKTSPTGTLRYVLDGDNLFMEVDGSGNPVREYTFFPGVDQPHSLRSGGQTYYYLTEPSGTVVGMVNGQRAAVDVYQYDPWGFVTGVQEAVANPLRFNAREYDTETGLYYNRGRYYEPELGRFISEDPIGLEGGVNPFAYGSNDPVNRTDPFGLDDSDDFGSHECHKTDNYGWLFASQRNSSCGGWTVNGGSDAMAKIRDFMNAFSHSNDVWELGLRAGTRAAGGGSGAAGTSNGQGQSPECVEAEITAGLTVAFDAMTVSGVLTAGGLEGKALLALGRGALARDAGDVVGTALAVSTARAANASARTAIKGAFVSDLSYFGYMFTGVSTFQTAAWRGLKNLSWQDFVPVLASVRAVSNAAKQCNW